MEQQKKQSRARKAPASATVEATKVSSAPIVPKEIDLMQYVTVHNGFQGKLVYQSSRTGEVFVWENFGDEQEMELLELKNAKSANKKFFENNWFMFDEDWIVDFLGLGNFYRNAVSIEEFDAMFQQKPEQLKATISALSAGQKKSAAYRAAQLIQEGKIDSNKAISTLEELLQVQLVQR